MTPPSPVTQCLHCASCCGWSMTDNSLFFLFFSFFFFSFFLMCLRFMMLQLHFLSVHQEKCSEERQMGGHQTFLYLIKRKQRMEWVVYLPKDGCLVVCTEQSSSCQRSTGNELWGNRVPWCKDPLEMWWSHEGTSAGKSQASAQAWWKWRKPLAGRDTLTCMS